MKKYLVIGAAAMAVISMSSCKSNESAYKKAYEKAQAQQAANNNQAQGYANQTVQTTPVTNNQAYTVTPTQTTTPVTATPTTDYSNVQVRNEAVTLVNGAGLKAYSVVVGSFGMLSNAQSLQATLGQKGFNAQIVQANVNGQPFYRVVATTFETKQQAAQSRANLTGEYPGAWLLYQK